jgi:hypothetical protein
MQFRPCVQLGSGPGLGFNPDPSVIDTFLKARTLVQ